MFVVVRLWCDVHAHFHPGNSRHNPSSSRLTKYVLPTCRGIEPHAPPIDAALLPVILLLKGDEACVLLGWNATGDEARLLFPETGQGEVTLTRSELAERYVGIALFARPRFTFDARTPEVGKVVQRHWFWGALLEQAPLYRDVLGAALLINVFALVMPIFSMNVYDRVVPNNATETLWMLALGVLLVVGMDFMMRLLRGHL